MSGLPDPTAFDILLGPELLAALAAFEHADRLARPFDDAPDVMCSVQDDRDDAARRVASLLAALRRTADPRAARRP